MKERNGIGALQSPDATRANYRRGVQSIIKALWECDVPAIAAINGPAIGLGLARVSDPRPPVLQFRNGRKTSIRKELDRPTDCRLRD
jgi:hypothetical protein